MSIEGLPPPPSVVDALPPPPKDGIPNWAVPSDAIYRAAAGTLDMFGNAPTNVANLGVAGYGAAKTALGGDPNKAPQPLPTPDLARRGAEKVGLIQPEQRLTPGQQYAESAIGGATLGLLAPEARLANAFGGAVAGPVSQVAGEKLGPAAGAVASMATPATMRAAAASSPNIAQVVRQAAARQAIERGFVIPPTEMATNPVSRAAWATAQGIGGKAAIGQEFSARNQQTINNLARQEIGLPAGGQISEDEIQAALAPHFQVYEAAAQTHPAIEEAVRAWRGENDMVRRYSREHARTGTVASEDSMNEHRANADQLLNWIDQAAGSIGNPGLQQQLSASRVALARIGTVERALGTGDVSARQIARDPSRRFYDDGGGFDSIARFYDAFPRMAQPAAQTQQHGVHGALSILGAIAGAGGGGAGGHPGLGSVIGIAAANTAPPLTRAALASAPVQWMASPGNQALSRALQGINPALPLIQQSQQ